MGQTLTEIAQTLRDANKKVQLIYAFNGTGKTRLSREFKALIAPTDANAAEGEQDGGHRQSGKAPAAEAAKELPQLLAGHKARPQKAACP